MKNSKMQCLSQEVETKSEGDAPESAGAINASAVMSGSAIKTKDKGADSEQVIIIHESTGEAVPLPQNKMNEHESDDSADSLYINNVDNTAQTITSGTINVTKDNGADSEQVIIIHESAGAINAYQMGNVLRNNGIDIETNVLQITFDAKLYNMKQLMSDLCDIFTYKTDDDTVLPFIIKQMFDLEDNDIQKQQEIYDAILRCGFITKHDLNPCNFIQILKISAFEVNPKLNPQEIEEIAIEKHLSGKIYNNDDVEFMNSLQFGAWFKSIEHWNQNQWVTIYANIHNWTSANIHNSIDPSQRFIDIDIQTFCTLTNADRDIALVNLQHSAWNVDVAVNGYFRQLNVAAAADVKDGGKRLRFIDKELTKNDADRLWKILCGSCGIIIVLCITLVTWAVLFLVESGSDFLVLLIIVPVAIIECIVVAAIYDGMKARRYYYHIGGSGWIGIHIIGLIIAMRSLTIAIPATFIVILPLLIAFLVSFGVAMKLTYQIKTARQAWVALSTDHHTPTQGGTDIGDAMSINMIQDHVQAVLRNVFVDGSEKYVFLDELMDMMPDDIDKETLETVVQTLDANGQIYYIKSEQKIIGHSMPVIMIQDHVQAVLRHVFVDGSESYVFLDELMDMIPDGIEKEILEAVAQALDGNGLIHYVKSQQKIEPTNIIIEPANIIDQDHIVHKVVLSESDTDNGSNQIVIAMNKSDMETNGSNQIVIAMNKRDTETNGSNEQVVIRIEGEKKVDMIMNTDEGPNDIGDGPTLQRQSSDIDDVGPPLPKDLDGNEKTAIGPNALEAKSDESNACDTKQTSGVDAT